MTLTWPRYTDSLLFTEAFGTWLDYLYAAELVSADARAAAVDIYPRVVEKKDAGRNMLHRNKDSSRH